MISSFIYGLNPVVLLGLILCSTISISLFFIWLLKAFIKIPENEIAEIKLETYINAFGVAFAILLGLIIVTAWKSYDKTEDSVRLEVNYLNDLYDLSAGLNNSEEKELRDNLKAYVDQVIHKEWPLLTQGKHSQVADQYLAHNFNILFKPQEMNVKQELLRDDMYEVARRLLEQRRLRIQNATSSLTALMWIVIISCSLVTLILLALGPKGSVRLHLILQGFYAFGIALMLFLMVVLDRPYYYGAYFGGGITAMPFKQLLHDWNQSDGKNKDKEMTTSLPNDLRAG